MSLSRAHRRADLTPATGGRDLARSMLADAALLGTFAAVLALFLISPVTLEAHGIGYVDAGGGLLSKLHPATFIASVALACRILAAPAPARAGLRLFTSEGGVVLLLVAVGAALVFAVVAAKTPFTPLIDTFVLPIIVFILLRDLDERWMTRLAFLVAAILFANAALAMLEFLRGFHLVHIEPPPDTSFDPTRGDKTFDWRTALSEDWRATAIFGHPLSNGVITGCAILCLAAPGSSWLPLLLRAALTLLMLASMFAFGARAALVLSVCFATWLSVQQLAEAIVANRRFTPRGIAYALVATGLAVGVAAVVMQTGFFDKTLARFSQDAGSASTRVTMFSLFGPLTATDILLGPDKNVVATLQRMYGLEFGIESSWIGLILVYGVIISAIIMLALLAFSSSLVKRCGRGTMLVLAFYFILVSASASLSGKTITFAMTVVLILVFLRKDERRRPLWPAARVSLV